MTCVVNLYGGPGTGKSTTAAHLFAVLKQRGINCEMAREYAKEKVWDGSSHVLEDQLYVFAKQARRVRQLDGKVDFIITDAPLLLSLIYYQGDSAFFWHFVKEEYNRFDNVDIFLRRVKAYETAGRLQTEEEAKELDEKIQRLADQVERPWSMVADERSAVRIADKILRV